MNLVLNNNRELLLVFLLATLSLGLWLGEVVFLKQWASLHWIRKEMYSVYPICLIVVFSTLLPIIVRYGIDIKRLLIAISLMFVISIYSFTLARGGIFTLHGKLAFLDFDPNFYYMMRKLISAFLLTIFGFHFVINTFLIRMSYWNILFNAVSLILLIPTSLVTILVLPSINGHQDYIHAVKMGYPMFWLVISMYLSTKLTLNKFTDSVKVTS